jgi:phosphoserine aminotransferase
MVLLSETTRRSITTMRVINFSAGPGVLPELVLERAAAEMLDWRGTGQSVLEMSHRGKEFLSIADHAERTLRELLGIPANYKVLLLQGGASMQFGMLPLNLMRGKVADYIHTGEWAKKAIEEAKLFGMVNVAASGKEDGFNRIPKQSEWKLTPDAAYVHYTSNETINGTEFHWTPEVGPATNNAPLVADMSSHILSRPVDVSKYGVLYFGAQKNAGSAGLTVVVIREDLVGRAPAGTMHMLDYKTHAETGSGYNTPPTYSVYIAGLVFQWIADQGGLAAMEERNQEKAALLYNVLDASGLYTSGVAKEDRSRMNVTFQLKKPELEAPFLKGAEERGMVQLKGHRNVGGCRASIYNAMPMDGVRWLAEYMREFEAKNG